VIHISKGSVGRGLESGREDRLQDIVTGEVVVEVAQSLASFIDLVTFPKYRVGKSVWSAGAQPAEKQTPVASRRASSRDGRACIEHTC
jgi:hypothetical protein